MTLSISDQPSQWRRLSDNPKRLSLLSDATIDPFPQRVTRSASLLEHHLVRDSPLDQARIAGDGRRSTAPFPPYRASPLGPEPHHLHDPSYHERDLEETYDLSRKRKASTMADQPSGSSSPASVGQPDGQTQFCLCQPEPKIPRPRNAFILYRQHQQAGVVRSHPGLPNPAISKIIGEQWSHLPEEEKDKWKALAEEEKARHAQQYPEYRYQPRRNGRYSSQSSGSGPPSGGKVDQQGNCIKCGGKTMNPPTTPYAVYPTSPPATGKRPLTYSQGDRGSQQVLVSPPRTGVQPHGGQMWMQVPPRDPRYDPRPRYMSEQIDGPDLKRRRYESGYVPTREVYREVPYPYSPREAQYVRADMHHDPHAPRSAMGPPRALYPQAPPLPPKLQPIRPPPPQHNRRPSLTLPPLSTPSAQTPSLSIAGHRSQNSGLEAMIMSIPILNKVKILSQISPHLAAPSVASPPRETRGAIVAVEGLDPASVYSMTNSLADQLVKDGKFSVRIFNGPDPFVTMRAEGERRKELAIADCLSIIGEWHKISEEMKKFITTKPCGSTAVSPDKDIEMSSSMSNSVFMTEAPATTRSEPSGEQVKTPERTHSRRPSKLDLHPPTSAKTLAQENEDPPASASKISPKSLVMDKTASLSISTPPVPRPGQWKNPWYRGENPDSPPYTRIPSIANRGAGTTSAQKEDDMDVETSNPGTGEDGKGKEKEVHFDASADTSTSPRPSLPITATPQNSLATPHPSLAHNTLLHGDGPIPIALVPSYQLTTVDASAISMPIVDSYSPLAHWQWLATLWRGCIGPDVSVVIKSMAVGGDGAARESLSVAPASNEDSSPGKAGMASPRARQQSIGTVAGVTGPAGPSASNTNTNNPAGSLSGPSPSSAAPSQAPGVEVRLLDCRTVVVRTSVSHHNKLKSIPEEDGADGHEDEALNKKRRAEMEFWEKAKRRVGFEVAEFLRR